MSTENVLVTGASGFIGRHLVKRLDAIGKNVTCLVRPTSNTDSLKQLGCQIVYGDTVQDPQSVKQAVQGQDVVFHLAASTHAIRAKDMVEMNAGGTESVLEACASCQSPPRLIYVSSIAAAGPNSGSTPHHESGTGNPISHYGRSKSAGERMAKEFAKRIPISIVRPPIVLGGGDRHGFGMFHSIDTTGWHFVPGFGSNCFSTIHVDDLATALIDVEDRGQCLSPDWQSQGIYFAAADEILTYSDLGKLIGQALGRNRTRVLRVPMSIFWGFALTNDVIGRLSSKAKFLGLDKCREAKAGSWSCSNTKIKEEVGFVPAYPLLERLQQTANWYRQNGWLKQRNPPSTTTSSQQVSGTQ